MQTKDSMAEVSCVDFVGFTKESIAFQGGGEGVNKALMTEADNAESRKSHQETTPNKERK